LNSERLTLFANVLLPLAIPGKLTYRVPQELNELVISGKRVVVQVGKRKLYTGIIVDITEEVPIGYEVKYILSVLDDVPIINAKQLEFWKWISDYYLCTLGEVMKAALPAALKLESESKISLSENYESVSVIDSEEQIIINYLEVAGEVTISAAATLIKKQTIYKLIKSLYQKGIILLKEDISDNYKPKSIKCLRINPDLTELELKEVFDGLEKRAVKQLEVLMNLYTLKSNTYFIEKSSFIKQYKIGHAPLKSLIDKGIIEDYDIGKNELNQTSISPLPQLTPHQNEAYVKIIHQWEKQAICLLNGVTSSGKTHIYFHLIKNALEENKQVLYIVPELSLTAQLVERITLYFGNLVEVTHSGFSQNERLETWNNVASQSTKIILGVRSSLFMPFQNLGLVIIDEEHESTLKQQEPAPRYHARETAIMLAKMYQAKVLLGSATPSIESWYNSSTGKYGLAILNERFGGVSAPHIQFVNIGDALKGNRMRGPYSTDMLDALEVTVANKKQAIVFQNRRGYVPVTECGVCGWTPKCINCDVSLTYYASTQNYRCNFCGFKNEVITKCGACSSTRLKLMGYGTERLEEELKIHLPNARIARFDSESTRNRKQMEKLIKDFEIGNIDILVGTQMLSKGLDFDNLDFVGVINADHLINFPDFRSVERSFQLLTQVAGRAGRRDKSGTVMVQTYQPWNKVLEALKFNDISALYDWEIQERFKYHYPPFTRIIKLIIKHPKAETCALAAHQLADHLKKSLGENVLGPESPHIAKIRNLFIQQIIIKYDLQKVSSQKLKDLITLEISKVRGNKTFNQVYIIPDVDAYF
jgi:primosomal protein N' (replication factor Y)